MAWTTTTTRATGFLVTAAVWNAEVVDNMTHLQRVAVATPVTSSVLVDVTTPATSTLVIALPATTYTAVPHVLYFHAPGVQRTQVALTSPSLFLGLYDGAAGSGMFDFHQAQVSGTNVGAFPVSSRIEFTPTAAAHTYQIRGYTNTADSWTVLAGASGSGVLGPITCSIYKVPI